MQFGEEGDKFVGTKYLRISGVYNESLVLQENINYLVLNNELDY